MLREYLPFWDRLTEGQRRRLEEGAAVRRFARGEMVYGGGTECAGLILLAKSIDGGEAPHLAVMDITAKRNAYGRQLGSFAANGVFKGIGSVPMTFIRAPYISSTQGAEILAEVGGKAVAARQGNILVTAFHPELTEDTSVHSYFLDMAAAARESAAV